MTKNQIEYNKLLELQRSNRRGEELTASRDMEVSRHNLATELQNKASLDEQSRANVARETETKRSNLAREAETQRSNLVNESLTRDRDAEARRSNQAREFLTSQQIEETKRSNLAKESLTAQQIQVSRDTLSETRRSNKAKESETSRSNRAKEQETYRSNVAREEETKRANLAKEVELNRHNTVSEGVDIARAATYATDVAGRLIYYNKDHGSNITVAPVQSNIQPRDKGLGSSGTGGRKPKAPNSGGSNSTTISINGGNEYGSQTGKTFWDLYEQAAQREAQQGKGFSQGGTYGGGAGRQRT